MKKLSARLSAVAAMVPKGAFLADVGSDHAALPIHLVETGRIQWAMAIDNKMGPFLRMKSNVAASPKANNHIICSHSDGISDLREGVDALSICGVGGLLACQILEAHPEKLDSVKTIVVDAHRDLIAVRKRISALGYHIDDEVMVYEDRIYYSIIRFTKGLPNIPYDNSQLAFGPVLMKKGDEVYFRWLLAQKEKLKKVLNEDLPAQRRGIYERTLKALDDVIESVVERKKVG